MKNEIHATARFIKAKQLLGQALELLRQIENEFFTENTAVVVKSNPSLPERPNKDRVMFAVGDVYAPKNSSYIAGPYPDLESALSIKLNPIDYNLDNTFFIWKLLPDGSAQSVRFWDSEMCCWSPLLHHRGA